MNAKFPVICVLVVLFAFSSQAKGGYTPIQAAAAQGDVAKLQEYLAADPKLTSVGNDQILSLLYIAVVNGQKESVEFLISQGVDVNDKAFQEMNPLTAMALSPGLRDDKCTEIAIVLIAHGAKVDPVDVYKETPLLHAVEAQKSQLAQVLLEHGANQSVRYIGANSGMTPLYYALRHGDMETVSVILKFQPPLEAVNRDGETPLLWAVKSRKSQMARLLLEHGASVTPNALADSVMNPLRYAFTDNFGRIPLHWAAVNGDKEMVSLLLEFKAPLNALDQDRRTPVHWAALRGDKEIVGILLESKAPLDVVDHGGATPLFLAEAAERTEIAEMLRQAGPTVKGAAIAGVAPPTKEAMRAIARRMADGNAAAFDELANAAGDLYRGIDYRKDQARLSLNFDRMKAAFNVLGEEAGKGNDKAFQALKKSLGVHALNSFAPDALGTAAAAGHQEALDILLHYDKWGILESSANLALIAPAQANLQPVVDYFAGVLLNPKNAYRGVYGAARETLAGAAAKGNQKAKEALGKFIAADSKQNE
jgi:ankyrin repeat protein